MSDNVIQWAKGAIAIGAGFAFIGFSFLTLKELVFTWDEAVAIIDAEHPGNIPLVVGTSNYVDYTDGTGVAVKSRTYLLIPHSFKENELVFITEVGDEIRFAIRPETVWLHLAFYYGVIVVLGLLFWYFTIPFVLRPFIK